MSLVEVLIAMVIVAIAILGGYTAVNYFQIDTGQQRSRLEASTLATKYAELFQADAYKNAGNITPGVYTYTDNLGTPARTYTTNVSFALDDPSGTVTAPKSLCSSTTSLETGEIWVINVSVTWPNMRGATPVQQTTEIAPGQAGAESLANASIAVTLDATDGTPYLKSVHWILSTVQAGATTDPAPTLPSGGKTAYSTANGCAVANNLPVVAGWDYELTLAGNPNVVSSTEASDSNLPDPTSGPLAVFAGEVTKPPSPIYLGQGQTEAVTVQPVTYTCGNTVTAACYAPLVGATSFTAVSTMPITVGNPSLSNGQASFGLSATTTPTSLLLYPYANGYTVWAGDMTQSSQGYSGYTGAMQQQSQTISVRALASGSVAVPVYRLGVQVTNVRAGATLVATEQSGASLSYTLNNQGSGLFTGGLPLGQYLLSTSGASPLSSTTYVWVTPSGVFTNAASTATPGGTSIANGSNVAVTES